MRRQGVVSGGEGEPIAKPAICCVARSGRSLRRTTQVRLSRAFAGALQLIRFCNGLGIRGFEMSMCVVLLGPPGCGKGTQADLLSKGFKLPRLTTGEMLRRAVRGGTELGLKAREFVERGLLVPDALIIELMKGRMASPDCRAGSILDGFPRTKAQAEALDAALKLNGKKVDWAILLEVPQKEILGRLLGRRECPKCGATYHLKFSPPTNVSLCDRCGASLVERADDSETTVMKRLRVYNESTAPLVEYYGSKGVLKRVDGVGTPDVVFGRICSLIQRV